MCSKEIRVVEMLLGSDAFDKRGFERDYGKQLTSNLNHPTDHYKRGKRGGAAGGSGGGNNGGGSSLHYDEDFYRRVNEIIVSLGMHVPWFRYDAQHGAATIPMPSRHYCNSMLLAGAG